MLAGIGGRTVDDAKRNISWSEFHGWMKYRELHGPLVDHGRLERGFAMVAHAVASTIPRKGGARRPKFEDFLPARRVREEKPISLEEAMSTWR